MTTAQTQITQAEWETLQFGPLWILSGVGGADANIDEAEVNALLKELSEAALFKSRLVREVLFSIANDFGAVMERYKADRRSVTQGLSNVADVLDAHVSPEEADGFKRVLVGIGIEIAKASGPVFGNPVSVEEEGALGYAIASLRVQPPS